MTTAIAIDVQAEIADVLIPARTDGLLGNITRDCDDHGTECRCVGHLDEGALVFWCGRGRHFVTFR